MTASTETRLTAVLGPRSVDTYADAVGELFRGVHPKLAGWVRRLVEDDDTAHEIASETFVRLLARRPRLDSPQSYVFKIAANLIRDHWRKTDAGRSVAGQVCLGLLLGVGADEGVQFSQQLRGLGRADPLENLQCLPQ
jgi:DNA-directed RNA polymerase specialized sigma24 family protein